MLTHTHTHTHTHTQRHTCTHTSQQRHTCTHIQRETYTQKTHMHTKTHIHTHTHTHNIQNTQTTATNKQKPPTSGMYLSKFKTRLFVFRISVMSEDSLVACGTKVSINYINIMCLLLQCIISK